MLNDFILHYCSKFGSWVKLFQAVLLVLLRFLRIDIYGYSSNLRIKLDVYGFYQPNQFNNLVCKSEEEFCLHYYFLKTVFRKFFVLLIFKVYYNRSKTSSHHAAIQKTSATKWRSKVETRSEFDLSRLFEKCL
jgi:hypothetical protein